MTTILPRFRYHKTMVSSVNDKIKYERIIYKATDDNLYKIINNIIDHEYNSSALHSVEYMSERKYNSLYNNKN